jgi:hypothetical protein
MSQPFTSNRELAVTEPLEPAERCANCGAVIGNLEKPYLWSEKVVCAACFARLQQQTPAAPPAYPGTPVNYATPPRGGENVVSTIIPYRNVWALTSYYLGLFSLFPCLGCPMGIAAVILGIKGLKLANANPQAKGKIHAIVGIVCGGIFGLIWTALIVLWIVMMVMSPPTPIR